MSLALPAFLRMPEGATRDSRLLITARGIRAFGDGCVSILLPVWLRSLGFSGIEIGAITTATLLGSAAATLTIGLIANRQPRRLMLAGACIAMLLTSVGFAAIERFWPLLLVAFAGTLNPSSGDVSVFLPLEQSLLPQTGTDRIRTRLFARYGLVASLSGAFGALSAGLPSLLHRYDIAESTTIRMMLLGYGLLAVLAWLCYRQLSPAIEPPPNAPPQPLRESRSVVLRLAALFSLDTFASGFIVQSMLALWLFENFNLSTATTGTIFFWVGLLSAGSFPIAARLGARFGLVNTMVFTHLPAAALLVIIPFMPNLELAIACLLLRSALSQMDVPVRNSYVMAVVTPAERPAAASLTAVPRSLASAAGPLMAGYLLSLTTFGWPLLIAGSIKMLYDVLLLRMFAAVRPPEEEDRPVRQRRVR